MKKLIKTTIKRLPFARPLIEGYYGLRAKRRDERLRRMTPEEIFTEYYKTNFWKNSESVSGDGSTLDYTETLRGELPGLFERLNVHSILDAPCGDYNWFRYVNRKPDVTYVGGDVVPELIQRNQDLYGDHRTSFIQIDITRDPLPVTDIWLCRDVLFHFSNEDVFLTLKNFINSRVEHLFTSSHTECQENTDITTGRFRLLNLELPPFSFPTPLYAVDDYIEGYPVRKMCLWNRSTVADAVRAIEERRSGRAEI
jgi:hypothetical protein